MVNLRKNKAGWIRVIEAVVAILLVAGIILIVINNNRSEADLGSERIYNIQTAILREIQLDNYMRSEIISVATLPLEWGSFSSLAPETQNKILEKTPGYLECQARLCTISDICLQEDQPGKTVYAESSLISSSLQAYGPRVLKLFCWEK